MKKTHIVILGAGFGGLEFGRHFSAPDTEITVIDRQNHHLFQPLLYQVATAGLSAPEIAQPIRQIIGRQWNVTVLLDEVTGIDLKRKKIRLRERGDEIGYDYLIIALGARTTYFGHDEWEEHAPGLKRSEIAPRTLCLSG